MSVITIARQFGAGGRTIGTRVAKKMNYRFLDEVVINEIAKKAKVTSSSVKAIERSAGSFISKLITSALSQDYMERLVGGEKGYIDEHIYVEKLAEVITEFAKEDNCVLLGRGSHYVLGDFKNAYHILFVADDEDRVKFMQKYYNLSDQKARQAVQDGDKRRVNLYKNLGKTNYNDPGLYHMVLNISKVGIDQAVSLICSLVEG